jgi:hypothetical protein
MFRLRTFCLYGRFVPPDVLSLRMFCPYGRFVSTDVLSLRTFCPTDVMSPAVLSPDVMSPDVLSLRTFCLRTFCLGTVQTSDHQHWCATLMCSVPILKVLQKCNLQI